MKRPSPLKLNNVTIAWLAETVTRSKTISLDWCVLDLQKAQALKEWLGKAIAHMEGK